MLIMKKVYVLLADGFETIEALTPVDVLRRCGIDVETVSITDSKMVISSHNVIVDADRLLGDSSLPDGDMIVIPGGYPGYFNLGKSESVGDIVKDYWQSGKFVAAICGGPTVLVTNAVAIGSRITCHSSVKEKMSGYQIEERPVVIDGKLITASGAGCSLEFSLTIAEILAGRPEVEMLKKKMEIS